MNKPLYYLYLAEFRSETLPICSYGLKHSHIFRLSCLFAYLHNWLALNCWLIMQICKLQRNANIVLQQKATFLTLSYIFTCTTFTCIVRNFERKQFRGRSQALVRGPDAKFISRKIFEALFRPQKIQGPLFAMEITGQPHRKACKLNFLLENLWYFFQGPPLQGHKF